MPPFAAAWALFLDVDGTLLDHAEHPGAVHVEAGLLHLIEGLLDATDGALALISGRSVEDVDRLFAPIAMPLAGQHGTERRSADGTLRRHGPALEQLGRAAGELVRLTSAHGAFLLENKGMTLALHFRRAPDLGALAEREMRRIAAALGDEFELQAGKFVYEIKPSGKDKGSAIAEFMAEAPFAGRTPVFIGDDLTDEYGFDVVNRAGGQSIKVGVGETRARWRLNDAAAVRRWLGEYLRYCGGLCAARTGR
jgi:trehalose 6-phosphate phosphatase